MSNVNTKNNVRTIAVTGMLLSSSSSSYVSGDTDSYYARVLSSLRFSDLPASLGAYALGPVAGIIICLI